MYSCKLWAYFFNSLSKTNGECVTAIIPAHWEPRDISRRNRFCQRTDKDNSGSSIRIIDFVSGSIYALKGNIEKIGSGIFLCTPNNIDVQGKITDENAEKKEKEKEEENINYEW